MSLALSLGRRPLVCLPRTVQPHQIRTYASVPEKRKPEEEPEHYDAPDIYSKNPGIYVKHTTPASTASTPATNPPRAPTPAAPPSKFASSARPKRDPSLYQAEIKAPRSHGPIYQNFEPKLLPRPIGMLDPPLPGQNAGEDVRTSVERARDATDYEKHLQRRRALVAEFSRPYFRDQFNLRHHGGKSFLAPPRLFKAELALFFPNLYGETLVKGAWFKTDPSINRDTTPVLRGRISIVTVFSSMWAESQCESFVAESTNPELHEVLRRYSETARFLGGFPTPQVIRINMERNPMRAWIVRAFKWSLRSYFNKADWGKYFLVTKGVTDSIRESTGILNSKAGYVYLVDEKCRIRWAGSGRANDDEVESLAKGMRRLLSEAEEKLKAKQESAPATAPVT